MVPQPTTVPSKDFHDSQRGWHPASTVGAENLIGEEASENSSSSLPITLTVLLFLGAIGLQTSFFPLSVLFTARGTKLIIPVDFPLSLCFKEQVSTSCEP
ncbi:hypothetical protein V6N13_116769 [Hibiscus sabdariffa]